MKLLSYYIENYGKLQHKEGSFASGLTCFCESNGSGKTTLASFIKAMFYGLPSYTVASKGFNDRQRFYPFNGGKFGGNLTFEAGGKVYRIERFFDKKSSKNDEVKVFCNGTPCHDFGENCGKELFGLDEESFQKTIFITADEIEIGSTHSINEKLNGTVEGEEEGNFEAALAALEKAKKELKAGRGNNDKISRTKTEIVEWTAKAHNISNMGETLSDEYTERDRLVKEISFLETQVREEGERGLVLQKWETLDSMRAQATEKGVQLQALQEKYPNGLPEETDRKRLHAYIQEEQHLQGSVQTAAFGTEKEEALAKLEHRFQNGTPTDESLRVTQEKIARLSLVQNQLAYEKTEATPKQRALENRFANGLPGEEILAQKRELVEEYKRKDNEMKGLSAAMLQSVQTQPAKGKSSPSLALLIAAVVALCAGIGLLFVMQAVGIVLLAIAVVLGLLALLFKGKGAPSASIPHSDLNLRLISLQSDLQAIEGKIREFTVPYGYYDSMGAVFDFNALEEDVRAYKEYRQAAFQARERSQAAQAEAENLQREIVGFLEAYKESETDLQSGLTRLISAVQTLVSLQEDKRAAIERAQHKAARLQEVTALRREILNAYALGENVGTMDGLSALDTDARTMDLLRKEYSGLCETIAEYQEKHTLYERPVAEAVNVDDMHTKLSLCRKELADCDKRIAETERYVETLSDIENRLAIAKENLKVYQERHALLSDTMEMLKVAEQSLKDKYVAPIKERFLSYTEALSTVLGEKISMDKDFHILFERGGEERSERHFSAGERTLCALCLRLALMDNLYETEQPFIVLDDPFVHLDEEHMAKTATLLNLLAKEKQILYFCCHESRKI